MAHEDSQEPCLRSSCDFVDAPSVEQLFPGMSDGDDVYMHILRFILLEYMNEPRFRDKHNQRMLQEYSYRSHSEPTSEKSPGPSESAMVKKLLPELEKQLGNIAMGRYRISNDFLRRCLLKFYNDYFLNPRIAEMLQHIERFEELILYFTKTANTELNKLVTVNIQAELHADVVYFIDILLQCCAKFGSNTVTVEKLSEYKSTFRTGTLTDINTNRNSLLLNRKEKGILTSAASKSLPPLEIEKVSHCLYFQQLFKVDSMKLEQDIRQTVNDVSNSQYCWELEQLHNDIKKGRGMISEDDFSSLRAYSLWKNFETAEIASLMHKFGSDNSQRAADRVNNSHFMIPKDRKSVYVEFVSLVLQQECSENSTALNLSQEAMFFIFKLAKNWRLDFPTTLAALIYSGANLHILNLEMLNMPLTENLFSMLNSKILSSESIKDTSKWNDVDQKVWLANLFHTSVQCVNYIEDSFGALYSTVKPKFSQILRFYYTYVEADPAFIKFAEYSNSYHKKIVKHLRRALFRVSKNYYLSLLNQVPNRNEVTMIHIQNMAEQIIEQIKLIQKRYSRPLLDKVNLAVESATILVEAFVADIPTLVRKAKKFEEKEQPIAPMNALDLYVALKEIRSVHFQIISDNSFPYSLEQLFESYLMELSEEVNNKVLPVIEGAIEKDDWKLTNSNAPFSSSVVDIFKMINESINMLKKVGWEDEKQIANTITLLLKTFSDGLLLYSNTLLHLLEKDLDADDSTSVVYSDPMNETSNASNDRRSESRHSSTWSFHELKSALKSSKNVVVPKPYQYKLTTCVYLVDIDAVLQKINDLDEYIDANKISTMTKKDASINKGRAKKPSANTSLHQLYTIRVIGAENIKSFTSEGVSNSSLSLVDTTTHREIGKTQTVFSSANPTWDEEFEVELLSGRSTTLALTLWHRPTGRFKQLGGTDLCGKATLILDPKRFTDDGFPNDIVLDLDVQGKLYLQVSLESERIDALFCIGRVYRTLLRARGRGIDKIVGKFSSFVNYAFSRHTLKTVCGHKGENIASIDMIYEAIVPLFDYLNSNLNVLAPNLPQPLLFQVILQAWSLILNAADSMLLPSLSIVKNQNILQSAKKSLWSDTVSAAFGHVSTIPGYGRPLSQNEVTTVFRWLDALCTDFFYNNGEGPPLEELKNGHYQNLLLIPKLYAKSTSQLIREVENLWPDYRKYLQTLNLGKNSSSRHLSARRATVRRKGTVMANSSRQKRAEAEVESKNIENDPLERSAATSDIVLRILLAKGSIDYVKKHISNRSKIRKKILTEKLVNAAVKGQRIK